jgi:hypothetical protein
MSETTEILTRLVRARTLVPGSRFIDQLYPAYGTCVVWETEEHGGIVSALVITESGEQAVFRREAHGFVRLVIEP